MELADIPTDALVAELQRRMKLAGEVCRMARRSVYFPWCQRLREAREWLGLTQREAAVVVGVTPSFISML